MLISDARIPIPPCSWGGREIGLGTGPCYCPPGGKIPFSPTYQLFKLVLGLTRRAHSSGTLVMSGVLQQAGRNEYEMWTGGNRGP